QAPRRDRGARAAGRLADRQHAGGIPEADRDRDRAMDRGGARSQHQGGMSVLSERCIGLTTALLVVGGALVAHAQPSYPNHTIRLIVPFPPGGINDTAARLIQPALEKSLGQPVIVDNRPAASGIVGTDAVAKAQPDGHTLLMVASSHTVVPATN